MKKPVLSMRQERRYLNVIVEAADHIAGFIAGADFQAFQESELLRSAVVQKLGLIGEAAARVSGDLTSRHRMGRAGRQGSACLGCRRGGDSLGAESVLQNFTE